MHPSALTSQWERSFPGCSPERLFAVVADIERYPEFVPGCVAARIVARRPAVWTVDNVFGFGPVRVRFSTIAELNPPASLTISSKDGPWRTLKVQWLFYPELAGSCLHCKTYLEFRSPLLAAVAAASAGQAGRMVAAAFENRIRNPI